MSKRIRFWSNELFDMAASEREYDEFSVTAIGHGDTDYDPAKGVTLALYVDAERGVLVNDVGKYETSLGIRHRLETT
jgi:hypothetical protein